MAKTLLHFNFKGGVGKTTVSVMDSYLLEKMGKKVLLVDLDPQANATEIINTTYNNEDEPIVPLSKGLLNGDISKSILSVTDNLDLAPADWSLSLFPSKMEKIDSFNRNLILKALLDDIKDKYDYIILDVPPTLSVFTNNAILASDYVFLVLQTQRQAYTSILKTAKYMYQLREDYKAKFELAGVLLYLVKRNAKTDTEISKSAKEEFGDIVMVNPVWQQERVKVFGDEGIGDKGYWDKRALSMYNLTLHEELHRIGDDK
ncbi:ParA family protein [Apilactobacillus micheneri]|uniref:ParA family protein n=1 Tax=Apilactobacillus micheneri TaxID=1899430 RepID=UPI000D042292|nr:AAA family ATPase [Apilactobacillus micheneri]